MSNVRDQLPYPDLPIQGSDGEGESGGGGERHSTVIDRQSHFSGNYRADSDLRIEGSFEGEIDCNGTVVVAEDATLSATVRARNVVIAGAANGEFTCDERFTISATGEMRGKARAATLVVEEGAIFEGEFRMGGGSESGFESEFSSWESSRTEPASSSSFSYSTEELGGPAIASEESEGTYSADSLWEDDEESGAAG